MQEVFEKIIEKLEKRTSFLSDCTKYGNKDAEQQNKSYSTMMMYEVSDLVDDLIEIVKQATEEYNNGWIPCSERLPEEMELVLIYAESTARGGSIRVVAQLDNGFWFAQTSSETLGLTGIGQYNVIAWQPLPPEYQPNICTAGDCPINDRNGCPAAEGCAGYERKQTNADRIRSFSDEELAEWLTNMCDFINPEDEESYKSIYNIDTEKEETVHDSYGSIMDWLQSEVEE